VVLDLTAPGAGEFLFGEAKRLCGRVDVVVSNAGAGWAGAFAEMPQDLIESLTTLNVVAPISLVRAALPDMIALGRGRIVFVSSIAGYLGVRGEAVYSANKAAILAMAESLRAEMVGSGVAVSVVSPTVVDTPFFSRRGSPYHRSWPRPMPPERVAAAICRAIRDGRPETIVPSRMGAAVKVRALVPSLYRALADRFA
jgi:short-subunit dehydrogenase